MSLAVTKTEVLDLIFKQLLADEEAADNDILEKATNCVKQMIIVSQKNKVKYISLAEYIVEKVQLLSGKIAKVI